jgi:hypothetical protein
VQSPRSERSGARRPRSERFALILVPGPSISVQTRSLAKSPNGGLLCQRAHSTIRIQAETAASVHEACGSQKQDVSTHVAGQPMPGSSSGKPSKHGSEGHIGSTGSRQRKADSSHPPHGQSGMAGRQQVHTRSQRKVGNTMISIVAEATSGERAEQCTKATQHSSAGDLRYQLTCSVPLSPTSMTQHISGRRIGQDGAPGKNPQLAPSSAEQQQWRGRLVVRSRWLQRWSGSSHISMDKSRGNKHGWQGGLSSHIGKCSKWHRGPIDGWPRGPQEPHQGGSRAQVDWSSGKYMQPREPSSRGPHRVIRWERTLHLIVQFRQTAAIVTRHPISARLVSCLWRSSAARTTPFVHQRGQAARQIPSGPLYNNSEIFWRPASGGQAVRAPERRREHRSPNYRRRRLRPAQHRRRHLVSSMAMVLLKWQTRQKCRRWSSRSSRRG